MRNKILFWSFLVALFMSVNLMALDKVVQGVEKSSVEYVDKRKEDALKYPNKVIFDGKSLGDIWKPYQSHKYHFSKYTKFENATLLVNVPEKSGWGQVGIESAKPIVDLSDTNESSTHRLKFKFDPENTDGYVIELEGVNLEKKSRSYNRIHVIYKLIDDKSGTLELHKDGDLHTKLSIDSAPGSLELVIQPNNVMYLYLPDGRYLQTTSMKKPMPTKGYLLKVYSKPKKKHLASKMALKSIGLKKEPFEKQFDPSRLGDKEGKIVLFDGKHVEDRWIPFNEQYKKHFKEYALFKKGKLLIDIPKDHGWGEAGILSPEPIIWLDRLEKDGEIKAIFSFDAKNTTGFSIVLGELNHSWKSPSTQNANLTWTKVEDTDVSKLTFKIKNHLLLDEELKAEAPSTITLSFKHGEIGIEGDTFSKKTLEWPYIVTNRALHAFIFSRACKKNLPVKMALNRVEILRKFGTPLATPKPAEGVEILPEKEIYGQATIDKWECYQTKAKSKEGNCTLDAPPLQISLKKGEKSIFGMKSKEKIIHLDRRNEETPLKVTLHFNPKKTDQFYIDLGYHHFSLGKKDRDTYVFKWGDKWARNVDTKWLKDKWNGKVNVTMAKKWTEIDLNGSAPIHRPDNVGSERYLTVLGAPMDKKVKNDGNLELLKITKQWLVPDGMTAIERWNFVDDEDFDPDAFLEEIRMKK